MHNFTDNCYGQFVIMSIFKCASHSCSKKPAAGLPGLGPACLGPNYPGQLVKKLVKRLVKVRAEKSGGNHFCRGRGGGRTSIQRTWRPPASILSQTFIFKMQGWALVTCALVTPLVTMPRTLLRYLILVTK